MSTQPSAAQARIIAAAVRLFAHHGVGGTSLQMIADEIGVSKAAVYHQYKTKEEIVRAVGLAELAGVEAVLEQAEAKPSPAEARAAAIQGMVDLAVDRRRQSTAILSDPVVGRLFAKDKHLHRVMSRLNRLLMGPDAGPDSHVETAMLTAAISGAAMHPLVSRRDDETLRAQLVQLAHRFLGLSR